MVDRVGSSNTYSNISTESEVNLHRFVCNKCSDYEEQLKEVINELSSAETIIKILRKELLSTKTIDTRCTRNQIATEGPGKQPTTKEWALITSKNHTEKPQKRDKRSKNELTSPASPSQPQIASLYYPT
jgi:hypothetical protein